MLLKGVLVLVLHQRKVRSLYISYITIPAIAQNFVDDITIDFCSRSNVVLNFGMLNSPLGCINPTFRTLRIDQIAILGRIFQIASNLAMGWTQID